MHASRRFNHSSRCVELGGHAGQVHRGLHPELGRTALPAGDASPAPRRALGRSPHGSRFDRADQDERSPRPACLRTLGAPGVEPCHEGSDAAYLATPEPLNLSRSRGIPAAKLPGAMFPGLSSSQRETISRCSR